MRAHALVLLVVVALVAPASRAGGPGPGEAPVLAASAPLDTLFDPGQQMVRRGEYAQAEQFYSDLAASNADAAPHALLLEARAEQADGDTSSAETTLQQVLLNYPGSDQTASAYFGLEQVRRAAGDCTGAMRALDAFQEAAGSLAIGPYAALQRAQCASTLGDWSTELSAAKTALSIDGGAPRLTQIEALERAAEADVKMGQRKDALDLYNRCLSLAGTRAYTAEMLFTTATLARVLGDTQLAATRFRSIVVDYADQARGPGALDALVDMGQAGSISPLQAGMVRLNAQDYRAAIAQFDQADGSSADWGPAQLSRAEALLKLGNNDDARAGLQSVADYAPLQAGSALLRLGQFDERDGDPASAEAEYLQMAQAAPDRVPEAMFRVGFTRYVRGDTTGAALAWQRGLSSGPPSPTLQAQLEYWLGRALPTGSAAAQDAFNRAAAAAPETYYGLRAQDQLGGTLSMAALPTGGTAWLALAPTETQERDAWFAALKLTPQQATDDVNALPSMRRAATLYDLGLRTEASWEVDGVVQQYATAKDVAHMSAVADWTSAHDQPQLTLRIGKQMRDVAGGLNGLPRALQRDVYPAAWGDIVAEQATDYSVDPLLMLAVMRQESSFDPRAQSGAQAMGLTQIVPTTARNIASRLGDDGFVLRDLFKPAVSVQFGAWFVSQLLGEYKGQVFPTLAAYDAGGGNVSRWMQRFGDDPDLLVEEIPFSETQTYLRVVYDNYFHYKLLYRRTS